MRILTRYILGEILSHTLIGCALFTFILFMRDLPHILEMVVRNSSTFTNVMEIFLFTLPNLFRVTIPMAVLVGVLLGLSRLAADSEIIAMRASGLGIGYFVRVASIVAVGGTLLGLVNSLYLAPRANQAILEMEQALETSQASYEIQPRVFYEDFKNFVLYVQDVRSGTGAANWRQVFMADVTDPSNPQITTAASATVVSDSTPGAAHAAARRSAARDGGRTSRSSTTSPPFRPPIMPLALSQQSDVHLGRLDTVIYALPMGALLERIRGPDAQAIPDRVAQPLRLSRGLPGADAGGRSAGRGLAARRQELRLGLHHSAGLLLLLSLLDRHRPGQAGQDLRPFFAVWSANLLFAGARRLSALADGQRRPRSERHHRLGFARAKARDRGPGQSTTASRSPAFWAGCSRAPSAPRPAMSFRASSTNTWCASSSASSSWCWPALCMLMLVFTFFELVGDILRNHIPLSTVGDYLVNLTPSMLYQIAPLAVLIAVLVTFGVLNRNSEIIAMKATGISLYRLVIPIVSIAAILAVSLFLFDQYYLPQANRRQEALRNIIKGRPPQTVLHPEQNWIFGQPRPGEPGRIFYYQFFDPDRNEFANLSIFEFDPSTFALSRRIFAARAVWDPATGSWRFRERLGARHRGRQRHRVSRVQANLLR